MRLLLALLAGFLFVPAIAHAAMPPDNVEAVVNATAAECRNVGGQPKTEAMLRVGDFNGDGGEDWMIDFARFQCAGAPNPYCGSGGCSLRIFLWSGGSTWMQVFDDVVQQYRLTAVRGKRGIEIVGAGSACGKGNAQTCRRMYIFGRRGLTPSR